MHVCPHELLPCELFAAVGCTQRVKRKDMPQHIEELTKGHMVAMGGTIRQLLGRLDVLRAELDLLETNSIDWTINNWSAIVAEANPSVVASSPSFRFAGRRWNLAVSGSRGLYLRCHGPFPTARIIFTMLVRTTHSMAVATEMAAQPCYNPGTKIHRCAQCFLFLSRLLHLQDILSCVFSFSRPSISIASQLGLAKFIFDVCTSERVRKK
jgi:hypothetical protein